MEWTKHFSKTHKTDYWFNSATGETSWTDPATNEKHSNVDDTTERMTKRQRKSTHKIAIIIPFREPAGSTTRTQQLNQFIPHMNKQLKDDDFTIFVIDQSDDGRRFNRGKLLNIGFDIARKENYDIFVFHDVDLLPDDENTTYYRILPQNNPIHIASVWKRYDYAAYFGGIVSFSREQFERINGYPNNFWGWGGEDDELSLRVKEAGMIPQDATGHITDLEGIETAAEKNVILKKEAAKCMNKNEVLSEHSTTWKHNGLIVKGFESADESSKESFTYTILRRVDEVERHYAKITVDVHLNNHSATDKTCRIGVNQMNYQS